MHRSQSEKPSDTQVSACRGKLILDLSPICCFAVVGPDGDRAEMGMSNAGTSNSVESGPGVGTEGQKTTPGGKGTGVYWVPASWFA